MTTSVSSSTTTTALQVLASASSSATQLANEKEIDIINAQIQKQLSNEVAQVEAVPDPALTSVQQSQVTSLQTQLKTINTVSPEYGQNANILNDLSTQLGNMQTAAGNGDATSFDNAIAQANIDINDLVVIQPSAPFEPDQISTLKLNGLGIGSSASYDLSTPAGQAAAAAAVSTAQNLVNQISQATTSNQVLAGSISTALNNQITALNNQIQQTSQSNQTAITAKVSQLTQQAQDQMHLIELALGNTQSVATALADAEDPPQPVDSVFTALSDAATAAASSSSSSSTTSSLSTSLPPILSLLT